MEKLYSMDEVAEILSVSTSAVRSWVYSGKIESVKIMGNRRIKETSLLKLINESEDEER